MSHVDTKLEVGRIALSSAVITIAGVTLNEWVAIFTIVYLVVQTLILAPKALKILQAGALHLRAMLRIDRKHD